MDEADWQRRVEALWAAIDDHDEADFRAAIERLVAERPPDIPSGCSSSPRRSTRPAIPGGRPSATGPRSTAASRATGAAAR